LSELDWNAIIGSMPATSRTPGLSPAERARTLIRLLRHLTGADRAEADLIRQQRKELQAYSASTFLALAVGLCVAALAIPDVVRPGGWYVAFVLLTGVLAVIALVAVGVPSLPERALVGSVLVVDGIIVLAAACQTDRSGGRIIAALFTMPSLYCGLFLPRWVLLPQLGCVVAGASVIMVLGGGVSLVTLGYVGIVAVSAISPAGAVAVLRGQLVAALRESRRVSNTDPLTGLVNRRGVVEEGPGLVRRARAQRVPVGVVVADVDHFKRVNDRHGHAVGDAVLRLVADAMRSCVRAADLVVRLGGEELAVVAAVGAEDLVDLAERIRTRVELVAEPWAVTVSLGVAWEVPVDLPDVDDERALALVWTLLDHADDLMYAAKRAGRNRVVLAS
jgi:diguanylate cyclase (GGDEF)-like protein